VESFTEDEWVELIQNLAESGTQSFVFTGGEPLLKPALRRLLRESHDLGARNTLSTNGILLRTNKDVLDLVHDVWIPLDGSDPEKNQVMRVGTKIHFQKALDALRLIQTERPDIDLTVRTVASWKNLDDVPEIGRVLIENGIDPNRIRWKIYQCSTSGPRRGVTLSGGWLVRDEDFTRLEAEVRKSNPQYPRITFQSLRSTRDTCYFQILPNGDLKIVWRDRNWLPIDEIIGKIGWWNIREQMEAIVQANPDIFIALSSNSHHG
jgi:MoaA/NifB/PqqE/SkfB family radical SAM enzyme